ncbi:MAG: nucleoside triphosphate pyrophosphatase [Marinicellaceae bacterium]
MKHVNIILASQSPRRKQLLEQIGIIPDCRPVYIDETKQESETHLQYCMRMAYEKALAGWKQSDETKAILGSDTIVVCNDQTLGKPSDEADAFNMLKMLSNNVHQVITTVCLKSKAGQKTVVSISDVEFSEINNNEIRDYISSKEPMDKAGSYAIQGFAAQWIKSISGSYSGIMGLPLYETSKLIREHA